MDRHFHVTYLASNAGETSLTGILSSLTVSTSSLLPCQDAVGIESAFGSYFVHCMIRCVYGMRNKSCLTTGATVGNRR